MAEDRYGADVLGTDRGARRNRSVDLDAVPGLVVEDASSGWCGAVTRVERDLGTVVLEDRHGISRTFPLGPGFLAEGEPVVLRAPTRMVPPPPSGRTASGSVAVSGAAARVACASRIFVEGRHDAELVERVWGDDLRVEGVVVEYLEGIDLLAGVLEDFGPGPGRRAGVLVDHLVAGSKESRYADEILRAPYREHVLVVGHPYIDIWQAVKPASVGIPCWPSVPRDEEWKYGIARRLGWPATSQADVADAWRRVLASIRSYADLEPALLGKVEELIDFVTAQPG
jgi:hypothetical protein